MNTPLPPTESADMRQFVPTSLVFQGRAYDIHVDTTQTPPSYFFLGKRRARYVLIPHPEQQVDGCPVYSVMKERRGLALAVYRLTLCGLVEVTPLAEMPPGASAPKRYILEREDRITAQVLYVHVADHLAGTHEAEIAAKGYTLVNAPRPLPGAIAWTDPDKNRHGFFFAAGPVERYGQEWRDLDAWTVIALTNEDAIAFMREAAPERDGMALDDLLMRPGQSYAWIASSYSIPWHE